MTTFDEREKSYEKKFAMDQELRFKAEARRNKLLGEWAGAKLGLIGPALEEISEELGEKVTITKLNIDENPDAPSRYGVRGIPTMILFKNGAPAATKVGAAPKSQLKGWLESEI